MIVKEKDQLKIDWIYFLVSPIGITKLRLVHIQNKNGLCYIKLAHFKGEENCFTYLKFNSMPKDKKYLTTNIDKANTVLKSLKNGYM